MFVCICNGITEKDIALAVEQGASNMKELREKLDIANQCGKCSQFAKATLNDMTLNYDLASEAA